MRQRRVWAKSALAMVCALAVMTVASAADDDKKQMAEPPIINPGDLDTPPSDATVLFGGDAADLSNWKSAKGGASPPAGWRVEDGAMVGGGGGGDIVSKHEFADVQMHVEFNLPEGDTKHHGNSGLYIHGLYEVQIIDSSSDNKWQPAQQCAGLYKVFTPYANVTRKPGAWQTYDIIFHGAKLDGDKVAQPARVTVFHNGVLVQYNRPLTSGTGGAAKSPLIEKGALRIQDHGSPVRFRNMWVRELPPVGEQIGPPVTETNLDTHAPRVTPPTPSTNDQPGTPPSDAVVLFDGKDTSKLKGKGDAFPWKVEHGYMEVTPKGGSISSVDRFGDVHMHVEWATPAEAKGGGQGRGNSGVFLHGTEVQVLDSYDNKTYFDGQAGAVYKQHPPLVNACRPPGQWQTYDIIYRAAKYGDDGQLTDPGGFTVLHNGIVIQDHVINRKSKPTGKPGERRTGNLSLQDHGNPVRYRNIWYRALN